MIGDCKFWKSVDDGSNVVVNGKCREFRRHTATVGITLLLNLCALQNLEHSQFSGQDHEENDCCEKYRKMITNQKY